MDDIFLEIEQEKCEDRLMKINNPHPNLKFTIETPVNNRIPSFDMKMIMTEEGYVETEWFRQATDTGLILNFEAVAPMKYKRNLIQGFIYRIWNACSTWNNFDKGVEEVKKILKENNTPKLITFCPRTRSTTGRQK